MTDVRAALEEYRGMRDALEAAVLPLASSVDGQAFRFQASLHGLELEPGGYVALESGSHARLGQILSLELVEQEASGPGLSSAMRIRLGAGTGVVLDGDGQPFHDAMVRRSESDDVRRWLERLRGGRAQLEVGEYGLARGVPFALDGAGFGRHTFLCGQSGSGKTYSLGVLLEHLLMDTSLRVVVLDPNSDYVRLGRAARARRGRPCRGRYADAAAGVESCAAARAARAASACASGS